MSRDNEDRTGAITPQKPRIVRGALRLVSVRPDSCHYLVPISIEIVEEFLGGFGDFGVEGEVLAVDLDGG